jgi:diguanylate cyclase (GGDEF)-like protein/PAS domain S-box-containing protein
MRDAKDEPRLADAVALWIAQGRPAEPQGSSRRVGDHVVAMAGVPDADWVIFRTAPAELLLGGPTAGRRYALWLSVGVAAGGGLIILLVTMVMLRPLRRLEQRALRLLHDEVAAQDDWPQVRGEIGQLSKVFEHVMKQRALGQKARDELLARMQAVMGNAPVGITFSRERRFDLVSEHFSRLFGYGSRELVGQSARVIYPSDEAYEATGVRLRAAFASGLNFNEEVELQRRDGSRFWAQFQATPVDTADPSAGSISIVSDVTESRQHRQRLSWTASHDSLTDLATRREFEAQLSAQLSRRGSGEAASVLLLDLDHFKPVNDTAGHAAGDAMLKDVAAILSQRVRDTDTVARLGGDEFAVLLRGCDGAAAARVAEQMRATVQGHRLQWQGRVLQVGVSIGVVCIDDRLCDVAAVMTAADAACYEAKRVGRNAVRLHDAGGLPVVVLVKTLGG